MTRFVFSWKNGWLGVAILGGMLVATGQASADIDGAAKSVDSFAKAEEFLANIKSIEITDELQLKISGQTQLRWEFQHDFDFSQTAGKQDGYLLVRNRVEADLSWAEFGRVFIQGQDSQIAGAALGRRGPAYQNDLDLRQLYIELKYPAYEKLPLVLRVGRQELSYGDERFIGGFNWSNVARTFEGFKLALDGERWKTDLFWVNRVLIDDNNPDGRDQADQFIGTYVSYRGWTGHQIDGFIFYRANSTDQFVGENGGFGDLDEITMGNRLKGKYQDWDYGFEYALQVGERGADNIRAFAAHSLIGYTFRDFMFSPRISFEYNVASGDRDRSDGNNNTFDNLFPTNHPHYGYMDFISLSNIQDWKLQSDFQIRENLKMLSAFHVFRRFSENDTVYNAGGAILGGRGAKGSNFGASNDVGQELDILITYKMNQYFNYLIGYSRFFSGAYFVDTGADDNADFLYVQMQFNW